MSVGTACSGLISICLIGLRTIVRMVLIQALLMALLLLKVQCNPLLLPCLIHSAQCFMGTLFYLLRNAIRVVHENLPGCRCSHVHEILSAQANTLHQQLMMSAISKLTVSTTQLRESCSAYS